MEEIRNYNISIDRQTEREAYYSVRLFCFPTADKQLLCQRKQNSPELFIDFASLPIPFLFLSLYVQRQTFFKLAQIVYHVRRGVFFLRKHYTHNVFCMGLSGSDVSNNKRSCFFY
jgi:hypothetical protein